MEYCFALTEAFSEWKLFLTLSVQIKMDFDPSSTGLRPLIVPQFQINNPVFTKNQPFCRRKFLVAWREIVGRVTAGRNFRRSVPFPNSLFNETCTVCCSCREPGMVLGAE